MKKTLLIAFSFVFFAPAMVALAADPSAPTFVPLTTLPGIKDASGASNLPVLLSEIYKICIGLAATLTVLQLIRAGVLYMGGDSITEKKEARDIIGMSIAGLLLVLSPTIVFGIINPNILKLDLTQSLSKLNITGGPANGGGNQPPPASGSSGNDTQQCPTGSNLVLTFGVDSVPRCVDGSGHDCPVGQGWNTASGACSASGNGG